MSLLSFISNRHLYLFLALMMYTSSTAQSSSKNHVQTRTFLDSGGTTFLRHIDYYDELGYVAETVDYLSDVTNEGRTTYDDTVSRGDRHLGYSSRHTQVPATNKLCIRYINFVLARVSGACV